MSEKLTLPDKRKTKKTGKKELPAGKENISSELSIEKGIALFDEGDYIQAIEVFSFFTGSGNLLARQYLARCYYRLDQYDLAYKHFEYLSQNSNDTQKEYATSMIAAIELMRDNYNKSIKILRSLPANFRNTLHLAMVYLRKYQIEQDEFSIIEAEKLVRKIDLSEIAYHNLHRVYHTQALIYQAQREYRLAQDFYQKAIEHAVDNIRKGSILNDYASLFIELGKNHEAKNLLAKANSLLLNQSDLEEAFNHKWYGVLALTEENYYEAKKHLEQAAKTITERKILEDLASTIYILADRLKNDNFYRAAECFATGLEFERLSETVNERNEKIISFIVDSFFGSDNSISGIG